jgi:hypothetical protein
LYSPDLGAILAAAAIAAIPATVLLIGAQPRIRSELRAGGLKAERGEARHRRHRPGFHGPGTQSCLGLCRQAPGHAPAPELAVLCGRDPEALQMDREVGAPEALAYLRRLNFQPPATSFDAAFARG